MGDALLKIPEREYTATLNRYTTAAKIFWAYEKDCAALGFIPPSVTHNAATRNLESRLNPLAAVARDETVHRRRVMLYRQLYGAWRGVVAMFDRHRTSKEDRGIFGSVVLQDPPPESPPESPESSESPENAP